MINSVVFSHDSALLASASNDFSVKIWDAATGSCVATHVGHSSFVRSVVFSHDSARLASASDDETVKIWTAPNRPCFATLEGHRYGVNSVVFSHDSALLASASDDDTVKIWDVSNRTCVATLEGHRLFVSSVVFSHDSARLASASGDSTVKIWDSTTHECLATIDVPRVVYNMSFNDIGSYLNTDIGAIDINSSSPLNMAPTASVHQLPQFLGYGLNTDWSWIVCDSKNVLWLPPDYRPSDLALEASTVVIGCPSGRVLFFKFSVNNPAIV